MTPIDILTVLLLALVIPIAVLAGVAIRKGLFGPDMWPRALGIGGGVLAFVALIAASILTGSPSELARDLPGNFIWALLVGGVGYLSGYMLRRRYKR